MKEADSGSFERSYREPSDNPHHLPELESPSQLAEVFGSWANNPPGKDFRMRRFAEAARYTLETHPEFVNIVSNMVSRRKQRGRVTNPIYAAYLIKDAMQHILRQKEGVNYQALSSSYGGWIAGTEIVMHEDNEIFQTILAQKEVQTNIPDRYKGPQLFLALEQTKFERPIRLLDVGCSVGAGLNGLLTHQIPHNVRSLLPHSDSRYRLTNNIQTPPWIEGPNARLTERKSVTDYINDQLAAPLNFGQSLGVDLMANDYQNSEDREWVKSCLYISELVEDRGGMRSRLEQLTEVQLPNLEFMQLDFAQSAAADEVMKAASYQGFDIVTIITVLNQLDEDERIRVIDNAKQLAPKVIIQDFARANPDMPCGLEFYDSWHPYTYRTMLLDQQNSTKPYLPEEIFWWSSGRCKEVIISPGGTALSSPGDYGTLFGRDFNAEQTNLE